MTTPSAVGSDALDKQILDAHARDDAWRLAELYAQASELKRTAGDGDAAGFLLTQAYVFALESGHPSVAEFRARLAKDGRELNE